MNKVVIRATAASFNCKSDVRGGTPFAYEAFLEAVIPKGAPACDSAAMRSCVSGFHL
jgi:hypothetical protein